MKYKFSTLGRFVYTLLLANLIAISENIFIEVRAQSDPQVGNIQFACGQSFNSQIKQYEFTTFAWNSLNKKPIITWNQETLSDTGFDPQTRCEAVSPRFQEAYTNRTLEFLTHGTMNGQSVICTSSQVGGECQTLLLTLLPENDPLEALEQLSNIFLGYTSSPLQQSSEDPIHEVGDRIYIEVDIEEFLSRD